MKPQRRLPGTARVAKIACLFLLLHGCSARPRVQSGLMAPPLTPHSQRWFSASDEIASLIEPQETRVLAAEGAGPADRVFAHVQVPQARCALLMARATPSITDIDLFVYAEDGTLLGSDQALNAQPSVLVCPPRRQTLYLVAKVVRGDGIVAIGAKEVAADRGPAISRALEQRATQLDPTRSAQYFDLEQRINRHHLDLGVDSESEGRTTLPIDSRLPAALTLPVPTGDCLDVLMVPESTVLDLDVAILDSEGRHLGQMGMSDRDRWAVICSRQAANVTMMVRPHAGSGSALVVVTKISRAMAQGLGARRIDLDPGLSLDELSAKTSAELEHAGYLPPDLTLERELRQGYLVEMELARKQECSRWELLLGSPGAGLHVTLSRPDGGLVAESEGRQGVTLLACDPKATNLQLELAQGHGKLRIERRAEKNAPGVLKTLPLAAARVFERTQLVLGPTRAAELGQLLRVELDPHRPLQHAIPLPHGQCVHVVAALASRHGLVDLRLVVPGTGEELAGERRPGSAGAFVCARGSRGPNLVELRVLARDTPSAALISIRPIIPPPEPSLDDGHSMARARHPKDTDP